MKAFAPARSVGLWAGAILSLLVTGLIAPSQAQAGCAHYVKHRSAADAFAHRLDPLVAGSAEASTDAPSTPDGPRRPAPCSGPSCSGQPASPTPPPVTTIKLVEAWACLVPRRSPSRIDSTPTLPPSCTLGPIHRGEPVFHPPRWTPAPSIA
ncbi:hypothetical protein [Paludisphaera mucosa]|uniref:Uncharacterized protein n=1 Tax=Paludisphaera mucosa TaxID=3030827 RepID=A0ABT6F9T5_9BACT|nr:hypothetical protein [Paludisphaera mucosa]MDG3004357.1 hypothetical protein [Paludisphaera mucosa]